MHNSGTTSGQAYIDYANSGKFDNVVPLEILDGGSWYFNGSAVAIANDVVLFSAHQALPNNNNTSVLHEGFSINFTSNFFNPGPEYFDAVDVVIHPDYQGVRNGPDLALAFFPTGSFQVEPLELYVGPHTPGTAYDFAGFGMRGTPATGYQGYDGNLRAGTNLLTGLDDTDLGYLRHRFLSPSEFGFQNLGILAAPGDSGGSVFLNQMLAGIISDGSGFPGYGSQTFSTYFTPETVAWIQSEIEVHAVPEPTSIALLGLGATILPFMRRRRNDAESEVEPLA